MKRDENSETHTSIDGHFQTELISRNHIAAELTPYSTAQKAYTISHVKYTHTHRNDTSHNRNRRACYQRERLSLSCASVLCQWLSRFLLLTSQWANCS